MDLTMGIEGLKFFIEYLELYGCFPNDIEKNFNKKRMSIHKKKTIGTTKLNLQRPRLFHTLIEVCTFNTALDLW